MNVEGNCTVHSKYPVTEIRFMPLLHNTPYTVMLKLLFVCLFVFYVPSTARSFRDGTPIYCPLRRMQSSVNTPFPLGIEPRAIAWQSISLPLRHASSPQAFVIILNDQ